MNSASTPATTVTIDSQAQFNQRVTEHEFLMVLFTAAWCDPCQPFSAVFAEVAASYPDAKFAVADIEMAGDLAANFQVTQVPAIMAVRERIVIDMVSGAMHAHELDHHVQMWQALDMAAFTAHFDQKASVNN